jgi:2,4-dienoyl-CoA reductase-like NADH-dependent reductase (Old Yellow Enzyme family)
MSELFEKTEINGMSLSNRFIRSATWDGAATDEGACTPKMMDLIARLADGGIGLIITGHAFVQESGKHQPWQLGIHNDGLIPGLQAMTDKVHEKDGKIVLQLGYGGGYLSKSRIRGMNGHVMEEVARSFGMAAVRAKVSGFDGVQILAAHGFLLSQFLCPRYNDRTDAYGGSIENRARALMEVLGSVRGRVGYDYPVLVKLNSQDFIEDGLSLEDALRVGVMLEEGGIDAIEVSGGLLNNPNLMREKILAEADEAYFCGPARAFKEKVHVPLILVGGIRSYNVANRLLDDGVADYFSMCRPFIREPDLIHRWKMGDLRRAACISCNNCIEQAKKGEGIVCMPLQEVAAETFFPQLSEEILASPPHPSGTSYKISIGLEEWDSNYIPVVKIQMAYKGRVSEHAPSFPLGTDDPDRVYKGIADLLEKHAGVPSTK